MSNPIFFPNLRKDNQRAVATGTKQTVSGEDHACLDVFIQNTALAPVTVGPLKYTRNGADQVVTEDTVTPANNRPLPVKLVDVTGDLTITANNLNVQMTHTGANPDSIQIGDGTDLLAITASGEANTIVNAVIPGVGATNLGKAEDAVHASGDVGVMALAVRSDAGTLLAADGDYIPLSVNSSGELRVTSAASTEAATAADNAVGLPALVKVIGGFDGANVQAIKTDAAGELQIDVLSSALPTGAATEAKQDTGNTSLSSIDGKVPANLTVTATRLLVDGSGVTQPVSGTFFQATQPVSAASLPLPAGAATEATLSTLEGKVPANLTVTSTRLLVDGSGVTQPVSLTALTVVDFMDTPLLDASSTNIPGSAANSLSVVASSAAIIKKIQVFDTTGEFFGIFTGAVATPTLVAVVGPGSNETVEVSIPAGTLISLRSLTTSAISVGNVSINFIG